MAQSRALIASFVLLALGSVTDLANNSPAPTFYRDVLPILQSHCQTCHRAGEIAPMPFETYRQVRPWASAIAEKTALRIMPPWFADPCCGHWANDPSLTPAQIAAIASWVHAGSPEGDFKDEAEPPQWTTGWNIDPPDVTYRMPMGKTIASDSEPSYQYIILPTGLREDRWVRMCEIRPSNRMLVHHAVAYVRPKDSPWLRGAPVNRPFSIDDLADPQLRRDTKWTASDILLVYAPGSQPDRWGPDLAKLLPAGSDIVLQMHYVGRQAPMSDRTSIGLVWAKTPPAKRVLSLQLTNDRFVIPPGDPNHTVEVHGSMPNDALLLSFFPHMHLRGKSFEYNLIESGHAKRTLLRVPRYDFFWQLSYKLAEPVPVHAGSTLQAIATFDNSRGNPHNSDPNSAVRWGEQTSAEMMVGFFDVAVDREVDKEQFFRRTGSTGHVSREGR